MNIHSRRSIPFCTNKHGIDPSPILRRKLSLRHFIMLVAASAPAMSFAAEQITMVQRPPTAQRNAHYIGNRNPLQQTPLIKLPVGSIAARGWLEKQLRLEADGFTGHLQEISRFLQRPGNAWLDPREGRHGWEEVPYWLKGFANLAFVLGDEQLLADTQFWIEAALRSQRDDGWFGPESNLTSLDGAPDLWPNMIMMFCLQDYYEYSGDQRVIDLARRYYRRISVVPDEQFLPGYWDRMRGGDLLLSIYWLYNRVGEPWLLELAQQVHRNTARWDTGIINWHNVNIAQAFGEPATYWLQSGVAEQLQAAYGNWQEVRRLYGQVPGGMFGSDENSRPGFDDPRQAIETCGMVEEMLSDETLLWMTGDLVWAQRCEDVAFNSLPAALTADLKALRYLTSPNMALSDRESKAPGLQNGGPMLHMNPHIHRCCQHNWGHGWPYFSQRLWFATPDNGLAALIFSASQVTAKVADGVEVTIDERTHYPFEEQVSFAIATAEPVEFPLYLRVPGWATRPTLKINGDAQQIVLKPGQYARIERRWQTGDTVTINAPMTVRLRRWAQNHDSVSVDRGPLTFSLKIGERYVRAEGTDDWPAWEIHPTTPWNYALLVDEDAPASSFEVVERTWPADDTPFTHEGTPIELRAEGKRIPEWQLDRHGLVSPLQDSPVTTNEPAEELTLIPMGAARLRITAFPVAGVGDRAIQWSAPMIPQVLPYNPTASHCFESDAVEALCDELQPSSSADHSIPRMTWWNHTGSNEWVEYEFDSPKRISSAEIYWFDDTGIGRCRTPASWQLLYHDGNDWQPVAATSPYGVKRDQFNRVEFEPVTSGRLRLEVKLKSDFSGGILEWRIDGP